MWNHEPACTDATAWAGIRTILVPPGIVAVPRRSPARVRKSTPWRPQPDGQVTTARAGQREWFSDRLFVEAQDGHTRSGYGASLGTHVFCGAMLVVFLITRPDRPIVVSAGPARVMPTFVSPPPAMPVATTPTSQAVQQPSSKAPAVVPPAAVAPPPPGDVNTAAPVDAPSGITPETGAENRVAGVEGGVAGGIAGGVVGGVGTAPSPGPATIRVGAGMKPPRKIKDVKPVYPANAFPTRAQGAVLIEAIIGPDGKVQEATVLHSVPSLDQAALDAVRQWEYEPSRLNGVPVAVVMTIVVNFALQ